MFPHPKKARVSIKFLIKSFLGKKVRNINPIVDLYNYASILSMCPIGGEDFDKLSSSELNLTTSNGNEGFTPLNSSEIEKPLCGEIIWNSDSNVVVCRSINFIESDKYKITGNTKKILFRIEKPKRDLLGDPILAFSLLRKALGFPPVKEFILNKK